MIQLGWNKELSLKDVEEVLAKYEITAGEAYDYGEKTFYEIENKFLREKTFCSWGDVRQYDLLKKDFAADAWPGREELQKTLDMYREELDFWITFITEFVSKYGVIMLRRYYDDVEKDNGIKTKPICDLNEDDLLGIEINQILVIKSI